MVAGEALVQYYESDFLANGGDVALNAEVVGLRKYKGIPAYQVDVEEVDLSGPQRRVKARTSLQARCVVNCAGLGSGRISALAGIDVDEAQYRLHPTKGVYFRVHRQLSLYPKRLIYPLPIRGSVGVHTTPDLYGGMRLGPLETWLPQRESGKEGKGAVGDFSHARNESYYGAASLDMSVSEDLKAKFVDAVKPFLPFIEPEDIAPESSGIHARLQREHEEVMRDWVITHEAARGLPNFFNLVGIESPGLTASAAIGEYVAHMVHAESK